jgi:hypothetical protein
VKAGLLWLILCALPLGALAGERYRNHSGYDLALDVPAHACARMTPPPGPDHGVVLLYDGASCGAEHGSDAGRRVASITFFVSFNVGDGDDGEAARSARQLAGIECAGHRVTRSRERLGGLVMYECVQEHRAGFVRLKFVAQKRSRKDIGLWQNYLVTISCHKAKLAFYRRRLHSLLDRASTTSA